MKNATQHDHQEVRARQGDTLYSQLGFLREGAVGAQRDHIVNFNHHERLLHILGGVQQDLDRREAAMSDLHGLR